MVNKVILLGRLGKDPEMRYTTSGTPVASFSMATTESWKDKDGNKQEKTEWHNIVAWKKLAEICGEYLAKGSLVFIEGKLSTRSWDDKQGVKRYTTEVIAHEMKMLGGGQPKQNAGPAEGAQGPGDEDIPF
jgi:single-strand DNA-binding protein